MKNTLLTGCLVIGLTFAAHAFSGADYMNRFNAYTQWSQNLPENPGPDFYAFIDSDTPLAQKLRNKWLYHLAQNKDWVNYTKHYKPTIDVNLQCFALFADYQQGKQTEALNGAKPLWLTGSSQPPACNTLFNLLTKDPNFDERLITQRIHLALEERNVGLARYLLRQYKQPRLNDIQLLTTIYLNPKLIMQLQPGELHNAFYLFGLKRMVSTNMDEAIKFSQTEKTRKMLSFPQQQSFLVHLVIYKAMRNHEDTQYWFAKIKPAYYTDVLLDWQIRLALKQQRWAEVERLVNHSKDKENPCWQYWLARALEAQGQKAKANEIYQSVAKSRNYYGFLASLRLNKKPSFENEPPVSDLSILKPYQPFTQNIKSLYQTKQAVQASRLLNDFVIELPKEDKSALAYWIATDLQWHGKSVFLSNTEDLSNQLFLRFPLAYRTTVSEYSKNYSIPPEFVYAIIRQESGFRDDVVSPAGARGLMQLMPATASAVAKREKITYGDKAQLFSSQKNINIGVAYLRQLAARYNRHPVLMAAAYNAGPRQVAYWLKNHPPKQMDIWIETLPWRETRNYLKNVIAFYTVYQYRMNTRPDLGIFMKSL
ncbi:transglycosylase SLT domain-containing protein [Legionella hackeliae]|uniref:Soluble lytic murein transglycosylase n=1 Tax=Legionella hackeliae TaxID=449 RepID=A0A0A8UMW0_LEGHA|nr:transglycosylase SLT domain-containing protein [Legionella hackeliae]KTD08761.1 soluble lytic murein transglycosylase [Legionella hackeliae]CEK10190.1 Soluble lytic murein transglycosylase [Legionella hackeliae]STX46914.1 soluble lytic murein transglycosylase [Legionella hackeliae]